MNGKPTGHTSQKNLRKKESLTQRYFFQGEKRTSNLMDFKKSSLMKIDLDRFLNSKPKKEFSQILSSPKNLHTSQSFRKSFEQFSKK